MHDVTRALARLRKRGHVAARPADPFAGDNTNLWKPASAGYSLLADKVLFEPTSSQRQARRGAA